MAVNAETILTFDNSVIREDLRQAYSMVSPEHTPLLTMAGIGESVTNTYAEWPVVHLAAAGANRSIQGDDAPAVSAGTHARRLGNHTQISHKLVSVSTTSEAVSAAANNIHRLAGQIDLKLRELKIDMEYMLTENIAGAAGSEGVASASAGVFNFLMTNTSHGGGGSAASYSGGADAEGPLSGYPNSTITDGTARDLTEAMYLDTVQACWDGGAQPRYAVTNSTLKRAISSGFTGIATPYKDANEKSLISAVDVYESDFGQQLIIPSRHIQPTNTDKNVLGMFDPDFFSVRFLVSIKQETLAKTGLSDKRIIHGEYMYEVTNEKAHGAIFDLNNVVA